MILTKFLNIFMSHILIFKMLFCCSKVMGKVQVVLMYSHIDFIFNKIPVLTKMKCELEKTA